MLNNFSEGSWEVEDDYLEEDGSVSISTPSWGSLARVVVKMCDDSEYSSEGVANAHLIAASPEMYKALEALLSDDVDFRAVDYARAVLAKARGGNFTDD